VNSIFIKGLSPYLLLLLMTSKWCDVCYDKVALFKCGACGLYNYCDSVCQRNHWLSLGHDGGCARLRQSPSRRLVQDATNEELGIEARFDKEALLFYDEFLKMQFHGACWSSRDWLLSEWSKNSKLLLNAAVSGDTLRYRSLLIHRLALDHRL